MLEKLMRKVFHLSHDEPLKLKLMWLLPRMIPHLIHWCGQQQQGIQSMDGMGGDDGHDGVNRVGSQS